jgi:membrane-bound lytic murein transglycosylase MltF
MRAIVTAGLLVLLLSALPAAAQQAPVAIPTRYDLQIAEASARWLPWDWRWLKAQYYAESALNPAAVSPAGARGIAQLMPGTHTELAAALRSPWASPHDVEYAIEAGAFYMRRMRAIWTAPRPEDERRRLAQASYNAGAGNIIAAQRRCNADSAGPCRDWPQIAAHLHKVTGHHHAETLGYVARIERLFARLARA